MKRCFISTRKPLPRNTSAPGLERESPARELLGQSSGGKSPGRTGRCHHFFLGAPHAARQPQHRQAQNRLGCCQEALGADALEDKDPQGRVWAQSGSAAPDQHYRQRAEAQTALQR